MNLATLVVAGLLLALAAPAARAAASYDACTGVISSLPATISTQGTWCLQADETTGLTSGEAILVTTNNVTIDCNGFKLGGQSAGPTSTTIGVRAEDRLNITVRNCNIRGFMGGVELYNFSGGGGGHVVEDNRVDGSLQFGIRVEGDGSVVRRNQVNDTWSETASGIGIYLVENVDVIDNAISSVTSLDGVDNAFGIYYSGATAATVRGNRIRGLSSAGGNVYGILQNGGGRLAIRENDVAAESPSGGSRWAVCDSSSGAILNFASGFPVVASGCSETGNIVIL